MVARFKAKNFFKNFCSKFLFCITHCVCIKSYIRKNCLKKQYYHEEPDFDTHPIHDLELGQL